MKLKGPVLGIFAPLVFVVVVLATPDAGEVQISFRKIVINLDDRELCGEETLIPERRANTTHILEALRHEIRAANLSAYIITSQDDHQGEYITNHDNRRAYVSGFTGSAGDAVVTLTSAALWTDSRYYLQAEEQLDCNWLLIKTGMKGAPSIPEWLISTLQPGESVSADPRILTYKEWTTWDKSLTEANLKLEVVNENLVDNIWGEEEGRPPYSSDPAFVLNSHYTGETWQERVARVRKTIADLGGDVFIVTAVDEIAWVLNLRGNDYPNSPFFRSYLVIGNSDCTLYVPPEKVTPEVEAHLKPAEGSRESVRIKNYSNIWKDLAGIGDAAEKIVLPDNYSYALGVSYRIYSLLPASKVTFSVSPILSMKDRKNEIEAQGLRNAHIRDAVALCQFLARLEKEVTSGKTWDELKAKSLLDNLRSQQDLSLGPSFGTISAFGPNSALPHYEPTPETNLAIDTSNMYMVDSGGQYLDGTTDVTRSVHFGTPTEFQREVYTRLLIGCIQLCTVKFPQGKTLKELEILLRAPLYDLGLDYGHGSTHGIGAFGAIHEAFNSTYHVNFFGSQEPGYYRDGQFGMRLENIVTVIEADLPFSENTTFLTFDPVTLVPYYRKLINEDMMSTTQLQWLNEYHHKIRQVVGAEMKKQGLEDAYRWLIENTNPIGRQDLPKICKLLNRLHSLGRSC